MRFDNNIAKENYCTIRIEPLSKDNFRTDSLDNYIRKQDVKRVYRKQNGEYVLVDCVYTEDWDIEKRRSVAAAISGDECITYLALEVDNVVGFIGLKKELNGPYMILDMMHVSAEYRGKGIGRRLFEKGKAEARKAGAKALYISACSSEETIAFYKAMGCKLAEHPIKESAADEPCDHQLICYIDI